MVEQARRDDVVAPPLAGRPIRRRVEVALPTGGHVPRVTGALVDALVAAAAGLDVRIAELATESETLSG